MTSARRMLRAATAFGLVVPSLTLAVAAQQARPRPMTLLDLAELPRIIDPQLSPDGRSVLYTLLRADWKANRLIPHIWLAGSPARQLTSGEAGEANARWSPDGSTILFLRGGQIMLMPAGGGEPRALTRHATAVLQPSWSPDGSLIYFLATDPRTAEERDRERLRDDVSALDEDYQHRQLWQVTVSSGAEKPLTTGDLTTLSYRVSRDGTAIVMQRAPSPQIDDWSKGETWIMGATGNNARAITRNTIEEKDPELSPDNRQVLFLADVNPALDFFYNTNLFVVPVAGGKPKAVLGDFKYGVDQASWAPDGRTILAVVNMGVHSEIIQVDPVSGTFTQLTSGDHFIPPTWTVVPSARKMVFQFDEAARYGDAWTLDLPVEGRQPAAPQRVTGIFDTFTRDFAVPRQEKFEWKASDGTSLEGILFYPIDYVSGTRVPLVVQMHGGPMESDKFGIGSQLLINYVPTLTAKGYAVFRPNYRGSSGYGNVAYRDVVGHYFRNMHTDVLAGVDALIKRGIADPDRMVLAGWSAGGHLANKLVTVTNRFKAASVGAGVSNWISMSAQTDLRSNRTVWFGGTPWQANAPIAAFWDHSPVKDVARARTPTIFFVGENDSRSPQPQSTEMYRGLKANGVPTHLYIAPREGHQWGELRHQIFKANTELAWFERYARGREYTPERTPGDTGARP